MIYCILQSFWNPMGSWVPLKEFLSLTNILLSLSLSISCSLPTLTIRRSSFKGSCEMFRSLKFKVWCQWYHTTLQLERRHETHTKIVLFWSDLLQVKVEVTSMKWLQWSDLFKTCKIQHHYYAPREISFWFESSVRSDLHSPSVRGLPN